MSMGGGGGDYGISAGVANMGTTFHQRRGNRNASDMLRKQNESVRYLRKNNYQDMVGDLEKAGLNPMLAFPGSSSSQGGGFGGSPTSPSGAAPDLGAIKQANAQTKLTNAQSDSLGMANERDKIVTDFAKRNPSYHNFTNSVKSGVNPIAAGVITGKDSLRNVKPTYKVPTTIKKTPYTYKAPTTTHSIKAGF